MKGSTGLRAMLLADPERLVGAFTEKLLAFAVGCRLEYYDRPAARKIVRDAAANEYR